MRYPDAPRLPVVDDLHGHRVADPYRWLEDASSAGTVAWSAAQDGLVRPFLDGLPGRDQLAATLHRLLGAGGVGTPVHRGDRAFFSRRTGGQQHAVLLVRTDDDPATDRPLLDPAALDPSGLTTLDAWSPSRDGRLLAYQLSSGGDEESVLHVLDVGTGEPVGQPLDRTRYSSVAWLPDGSGFYYVRRESLDSPFDRRVLLHRLADDRTAAGTDTYVFGKGRDPRTYYGVSLSTDGRWLVVTASVGTEPRDDVWIADLSAGPASGSLTVVQEGVDARCSAGVAFDGRLYVWTDRDAPRGRLCIADPTEPTVWHDLVVEDPGAVLADFAVTDDAVVVCRSRHALSELAVHDRVTGEPRGPVDLPGPGTVTAVVGLPDGGSQVWIGWTDWTTPPGVLVCDVDGTVASPRTWQSAPGGAPELAVAARQEVYRSADGTEVRLSVLAPVVDDGSGGPDRPRPTVLYGYGGFGIPMDPGYTTSALAWVAAGGVWAVANLRGGTEEGEDWHRAGMREHKQNVFDDLHAAAEHLRSTGRASRLGIYGGSNGGLLVGAALTQRPDLYDAVVCSAPLLDMVRYELFGLGRTWNDEYGTADDPTELGWLLSYSPYHAVADPGQDRGTTYPATLFEVFESDTRVDPLHARKLCAALQAVQPDDGPPILLRRETDVGHSARSVDRTVALSVDTLSFLADQLDLDLSPLAGSGAGSGRPGTTTTGEAA